MNKNLLSLAILAASIQIAGCAVFAAESGVPPYACESFAPEVSGAKTGYFHTHRTEDGRWWIIDPLGRGFCVFGVDWVSMRGISSWMIESYPQEKANLRRYGSREGWEKATLERLKSWGFNTFSGGCDKTLLRRGLVHSVELGIGRDFCDHDRESFIGPNDHIPGCCFPNVFHPDFASHCKQYAAKRCAPHKDDPWLLGWFLDNELGWTGGLAQAVGYDEGLFLAVRALPPTHSARKALEAFLQSRQVTGGEVPSEIRRAFVRLCADRYFEIACAAIRKADPNHMILGTRFASTGGAELWKSAGRFCDVLTVNCYSKADLDRNVILYPDDKTRLVDEFRTYYAYAQKPVLVTEWSFPALDSDLPCTVGAGQRFRTQTERTRASRLFAETLLGLPFVVGYDYFMWTDQLPTGSSCYFQENTNYGLTDNRGEAYPELTAMFADVQTKVYRARTKGLPVERPAPAKRFDVPGAFLSRMGLSDVPAGAAPVVGRMQDGVLVVTNGDGLELTFRSGKGKAFVSVSFDGVFCGSFRLNSDAKVGAGYDCRDYDHVRDLKFANDGPKGIVTARLAEASGAGLDVRVTVYPHRSEFLLELLSYANAGVRSAEVESFWGVLESPFRDYCVPDSVPNLWKRPPYSSWFGSDGHRLGLASLASHVESVSCGRAWTGAYSGTVRFAPDGRLSLKSGERVALDGYYTLVAPGRGGRQAWRKFVEPLCEQIP